MAEKKIYGIDYPITLYATVYVEASSADEAMKMGEKLLDSQRFIEDELAPRWGDFPYYGDNIGDLCAFFTPDEETLDVSEYLGDEK